jgi:hypothetical protein
MLVLLLAWRRGRRFLVGKIQLFCDRQLLTIKQIE